MLYTHRPGLNIDDDKMYFWNPPHNLPGNCRLVLTRWLYDEVDELLCAGFCNEGTWHAQGVDDSGLYVMLGWRYFY